MPVTFYQPGVAGVHTKTGGGTDDGVVSWHLEGHWSLNQAGYAAILTQISSYLAGRVSGAFTGNATNAPFQINDSLGMYSCANSALAAQSASISAIVSNTGFLNGGN